jgi:TctA family transporter
MSVFDSLLHGLAVASSLENLLYCLVGCLLGTLIGVLPGIGPAATIALLLPITYTLDPVSALIMLAGIYYGAQYGGSTTAILINLPGEASSAVTTIDGYRMAQQGRAGVALATAAICSFFAGTFATLLVALFAPPLTTIALSFGAPEYFALITLGLVSAVALAHGSILNALAMIITGLLLGLVGTDLYTGAMRFTMGQIDLADGLDFIAVSVGVFGIAEVLKNLEDTSPRTSIMSRVTGLMPTREDWRRMIPPMLRGSILGSLLGPLPGAGATVSAFGAYAVEKRISRNPEKFGNGAIEGVAAPEAANNACAQTSFIPMLTLGIPVSPVMAMMLGALTIQGIVPGPRVITQNPDLFWGLIASMWVGNVMLVLLNLPLVGLWVKLLAVPYRFLFPAILAFSVIGVFSVNFNVLDLVAVSAFGLLGYLLSKFDCEPAPLLLGFVLGPLLEEHFRRAMIISHGDLLVFFKMPISAGLLGVAALLLAIVFVPAIRNKRDAALKEE